MAQPLEYQTEPDLSINRWAALWRVLTHPRQTFEALSDDPPILPGYLLYIVGSLPLFLVTVPILWKEASALLPPGAPEPVLIGAKIGLYAGGAGGVLITPWVLGLIYAFVLWIWGRFHDGPVRFAAYYGIVGYAIVPGAISSLLVAAGVWLTGNLQFAAQFLSLAGLFPDVSSPFLRAFLLEINPLGLWILLLFALGFSTLHKISLSKTVPLVAALFACDILITALFL